MKQIKRLKLNDWSEERLEASGLQNLRGGNTGSECKHDCVPALGEDSAREIECDQVLKNHPTLPPYTIYNPLPDITLAPVRP